MANEFGSFNFTNPFSEFLEENPRSAYYAQEQRALGQMGSQSPQPKRFFQGQFQASYNQSMGELGQQAQGGQIPSRRFGEFLEDFPFSQDFRSLPPALRGASVGAYSPQARFLF